MTESWFYFSRIGIKMIEQFKKTGNLNLSEEEFELIHNMNEIQNQIYKQLETRLREREERREKEKIDQEISRPFKEEQVESDKRERKTVEIDYEEEERFYMEKIRAARARKAQKEAVAQILPLRQARAGELFHKQEEIKRRIYDLELQAGEILKEIDAVQRGEFDEELTRTIISNATQIQIAPPAPTPAGEKRERKIITRRPLTEVIKSKTRFRLTLKGTTYFCDTEKGGSFTGEGETFTSLNRFCEAMVKRSGDNRRKISAYETVDILINASGEWHKLGLIYTSECTAINP